MRIQDLGNLADAALFSRDPERMRRFADALGGLPETVGPTPPALERPLWHGLTEEDAWLEELRRARDQVRDGLVKTRKPVPAGQHN